MARNLTQIYDEISSYTLTGKISLRDMENIMYSLFKKRKIHLLDNDQLETLLIEIKKFYEKGLK